jgi:hypothetical protein
MRNKAKIWIDSILCAAVFFGGAKAYKYADYSVGHTFENTFLPVWIKLLSALVLGVLFTLLLLALCRTWKPVRGCLIAAAVCVVVALLPLLGFVIPGRVGGELGRLNFIVRYSDLALLCCGAAAVMAFACRKAGRRA